MYGRVTGVTRPVLVSSGLSVRRFQRASVADPAFCLANAGRLEARRLCPLHGVTLINDCSIERGTSPHLLSRIPVFRVETVGTGTRSQDVTLTAANDLVATTSAE
jgi:hypothetical protein